MDMCRLSDNLVSRVSQAFSEVLKGMVDKDTVFIYIAKMAHNLHHVIIYFVSLNSVCERIHHNKTAKQILRRLRIEIR